MPKFVGYNKNPRSYTGVSSHSQIRSLGRSFKKHATYDNARKALDLAIKTKKLLNVEYKFFDTQAQNASMSQTGTALNLVLSNQGTSDITRVGNSIRLTRVNVNYIITMNASATSTICRYILAWDSSPNGSGLTMANTLEDSSVTDNLVSPYNIDSKRRIHVLYDKVHTLNINANRSVAVHFSIPLDHHVRYDGNAGDVTDLSSGNLAALHFTSEATNTPTLTHFERVRFIDN